MPGNWRCATDCTRTAATAATAVAAPSTRTVRTARRGAATGICNGAGSCSAGFACSGIVSTRPTTPLCRPAACGDGIVETGEQCDDGNAVNGDGCDSCVWKPGVWHCAVEPEGRRRRLRLRLRHSRPGLRRKRRRVRVRQLQRPGGLQHRRLSGRNQPDQQRDVHRRSVAAATRTTPSPARSTSISRRAARALPRQHRRSLHAGRAVDADPVRRRTDRARRDLRVHSAPEPHRFRSTPRIRRTSR